MIRDKAVPAFELLLSKIADGEDPATLFPENRTMQAAYPDFWSENPWQGVESGTVALIPVIGIMMKYGYPWRPGIDDIANILRSVEQNPNIDGSILIIDTPGGSSTSILNIEDILVSRTKPCIALIDGICCSGGIYLASFCDAIYALNRMCEVGSIGTFATLVDNTKFLEAYGYKVIYVYPPESKYKNLAVREAIDGKPERLIREQLTPFAVHFQDTVKRNRPKLDTSVEGILEGRDFYAFEAVQYRLIDGIMNLDQAIDQVKKLADAARSLRDLTALRDLTTS
jgi:protease-4